MKPSPEKKTETTITSIQQPKPFAPEWAESPGAILKNELDSRSMSQADLAARTGISTKHLNQVIKGLAALSGEMAIKLELALGISSQFWMAAEAAYRDRILSDESQKSLEKFGTWLQSFTKRDLCDRNIIRKDANKANQIHQLLQFFGVADPDAYDRVWAQPIQLSFRRSQQFDVNPFDTAVWLRLGEQAADSVETKPFDSSAVRKVLLKVRALTKLRSKESLPKLQALCASAGVAVVFVNAVGASHVQGATRWITPEKVAVILSSRQKRDDILWFTFFHEMGHVLLHPHRPTYVDLRLDDDKDGLETEADVFAKKQLFSAVSEDQIRAARTRDDIIALAEACDLHPGQIAGAHGYLTKDYRTFAKLRQKLDLELFV